MSEDLRNEVVEALVWMREFLHDDSPEAVAIDNAFTQGSEVAS